MPKTIKIPSLGGLGILLDSGKAPASLPTLSGKWPAIYHRAVQIADRWTEYEHDSHHNDCYKKKNKRIFDQSLPFLTW
jgi:hypothetical protein